MVPIEFSKERDIREKAIQARLIDIRKAQIEYRNVYGVHAANFGELEKFLNEKKLPFIIKEGELTDEQLAKGMTEKEAVKKGLIKRDTLWVIAKDTLFGKDYKVDSLSIVPALPEGMNVHFTMDTATILSKSGYEVKVFECGVKYDDYLKDLNHQELVNLKDKIEKINEAVATTSPELEKFAGLRVGNVKFINNNAGNWE
jgi:hypothetical protein